MASDQTSFIRRKTFHTFSSRHGILNC